MPLRERLRRAFTRSSDSASTKSKSSSKDKDKSPSTYGPGDKMPPLKYRRPVDPEHKAKLEKFNWAQAWRRKSDSSVYSPLGSRMASRRNSFATLGRRSIGARSVGRTVSFTGTVDGDGSAVDSGVGVGVRMGGSEQMREGSEEEGDVANVGLSRHPTHESKRRPSSAIRRSQSRQSQQSYRSVQSASPTMSRRRPSSGKQNPEGSFSPDDLSIAIQRSHLETPTEERGSVVGSAATSLRFETPVQTPAEERGSFMGKPGTSLRFETPAGTPVGTPLEDRGSFMEKPATSRPSHLQTPTEERDGYSFGTSPSRGSSPGVPGGGIGTSPGPRTEKALKYSKSHLRR